jgi:iron complex outermembrane receptor protein
MRATINRYTSLAIVLASIVSSAACAQSGEAAEDRNSSVLGEIVVTAQKREQNMQDVGISVTAFAREQIKALGYTNTVDIANQTPAMQIKQFHPEIAIIAIRGIAQNDFASHHEAPIAIYTDGAYLATMNAANTQMYDMERVEVLRGPQGTLFGRNATGGLIHFITEKPGNDFGGYLDVGYAEYNDFQAEGAVNLPLSDKVLTRFAFATHHNDGWMKNRIGHNLNDMGTVSVRGQVRLKPTDDLDILLKVQHTKDDMHGWGFSHAPSVAGADGLGRFVGRNEVANFQSFIPGVTFQTCAGCDAWGYREPDNNPRTGSLSNVGEFRRKVTSGTLTINWDLGAVDLTALSDYVSMKKFLSPNDVEAGPGLGIDINRDQNFEQYSQELRLSGSNPTLNWTTGLYYLNVNTHEATGIAQGNIGPFILAPVPVVVANTYDGRVATESWAGFGHVEYRFTPQLSVIAALRYTEDVKKANYDLLVDGVVTREFNRQISPLARQKFTNYSAKAEIDWKPSDDTLLFLSYNRGHKSGSFNFPFILSAPVPDSFFTHKQEVLTSYEAGLKTTFLDRRVRFNASAYYYDYKDYQAAFFVNLAQIIGNLDAEVWGGEAELTLNPVDGLDILVGASYNDNVVKGVGMPDGSVQDRHLPLAPHLMANGLVRYSHPVAGGDLALQVDANYSGKFCFSVVCNNTEREGSYAIANARIVYTDADKKWSAELFVRNFTKTDYRTYGLDASFLGFTNSMYNPPRMFGGKVRINW